MPADRLREFHETLKQQTRVRLQTHFTCVTCHKKSDTGKVVANVKSQSNWKYQKYRKNLNAKDRKNSSL